jgi:hypothetical protein
MGRPRLDVQHCVVNMTTRQYGPHPTSDLLGVDYFHTVPADTEFPRTVARLELFVRFFGAGLRPTQVRVTVSRLNPDGTDRDQCYDHTFPVCTTALPGPVVIDRGYKLLNVQLPGEGEYAVRVLQAVKRRWEPRPGWRVLAAEYFWVERAP